MCMVLIIFFYSYSYKLTNTGSVGVCVLNWNTILDDNYWASSVAAFKGDKFMDYEIPIIPLQQHVQDADYIFIGSNGNNIL